MVNNAPAKGRWNDAAMHGLGDRDAPGGSPMQHGPPDPGDESDGHEVNEQIDSGAERIEGRYLVLMVGAVHQPLGEQDQLGHPGDERSHDNPDDRGVDGDESDGGP